MMYLDMAKNRAKRQIPMKMKDWVEELNTMLKTNRYEVLDNKGNISAEQAKKLIEKVLIFQRFLGFLLEAPPGFGPGIRVLQTRALPLGYGAMTI